MEKLFLHVTKKSIKIDFNLDIVPNYSDEDNSQISAPVEVDHKLIEVQEAQKRYKRQQFCDKVCSNWLGELLVHTDCKCPPMNLEG